MSTDRKKMLTEVLKLFREKYSAEFFQNESGEAHISLLDGDRQITLRLDESARTRNFLLALIRKNEISINMHLMEAVLDDFAASAYINPAKRIVSNRVALHSNGSVFVDLGRHDYSAVEICKAGVRVVQRFPVHFFRSEKQLSLPIPKECKPGEFYKLFSEYCNFESPNALLLTIATLLKYVHRDGGSNPITVVTGQQGSGKSFFSNFLKRLIDPSHPNLSSPPKNVDEIIVQTKSSYFLGIDNLSGLTPEMADTFCRLSTGAGISRRKFYSNDAEVVYNLHNPCILNGIDDPSHRADFLERALILVLSPIPTEKRRAESSLNKKFNEDYPQLVGGLYYLLSACMAKLDSVQSDSLPRMTDFARMGIALEKVLGLETGTFLSIYASHQDGQTEISFWQDPLCCWIHERLNRKSGGWHDRNKIQIIRGTASELVNRMGGGHSGSNSRSGLPRSPRAFAGYLRRIEPILSKMGIIIEEQRNSARREFLIFEKSEKIDPIDLL